MHQIILNIAHYMVEMVDHSVESKVGPIAHYVVALMMVDQTVDNLVDQLFTTWLNQKVG